ncbi:MAG: DUF4214 domain-containing protein [Beijerinckiaceae bacterium]
MALEYVLVIAGLDGGYNGPLNPARQWPQSFKLTSFNLDATQTGSIVNGAISVGREHFSSLTVDFASGTSDVEQLLAGMFNQSSQQYAVPGKGYVEIQGFSQAGVLAYDLMVADVYITNYHDSNSGFREVFTFDKIQIKTTPINPDGTAAGSTITQSYDLLIQRPGAVLPLSASSSGKGYSLTSKLDNTTKYYLTVNNVDGGVTDPAEKGAFLLTDYSFDVTRPTITSPVTYNLTASFSGGNTSVDQIFQLMSGTGGSKGSIELKGQDSSGFVIYDLLIGDAVIADFRQGITSDTLTFNAGSAIVLNTHSKTDFRPQVVDNSTSWNLIGNSPSATVAAPTPAPSANISITTADKVTNQPLQVISGVADQDETGLQVLVFDGPVLVGTTTVRPDATWSLPVTLIGNGVHVIEATLTDADGNAAFSNLLNITLAGPTSVQQEVMGLYSALYGRASEFPAYSFWVGSAGPGIDTSNAATTAVTLAQATALGQGFVNSQNTFFSQTYGALTDSQFIDAMYLNIGGASGDPNGIGYWSSLLAQAEAKGQSVQAARAGLVGQFVKALVGFDTSARPAEVTDQQWADALTRQETINNKIAVSLAYANASKGPGGSILVPAAVGDAAYNAAVTVLQGVTSDSSTVTTALLGIANAVAHNDLTLI